MQTFPDIRLLYLRELRSALRERNIVVNSILLPIFLYPLILWLTYAGISFVGGQTEGFASRVMLRGLPERHARVRLELEQDSQILLREDGDPLQALRDGNLDLLVEFLPAPAASGIQNFSVRLTHDNSKDRSSIARDRLADRLDRYRELFLAEEAARRGLSPAALQQFWVESRNVATGRQMGQFILGLLLPLCLIVMLSVGCMYPAIDSTAGEREKSTWETLMTAATPRRNIVIAKFLYVATMASVAGILNLAAMLVSMRSILAPLLAGRENELSFRIPLVSLPVILAVTILLALFIAAGMMILASFARTFKEGQALVSPFYLATFLPLLFLQAPGIEFTTTLALIPVVNVALVFREAIAGVIRWPLVGITLAVEAVCIVLALWLAASILKYEDFLLGNYSGNVSKFLKERLLARRRGRT